MTHEHGNEGRRVMGVDDMDLSDVEQDLTPATMKRLIDDRDAPDVVRRLSDAMAICVANLGEDGDIHRALAAGLRARGYVEVLAVILDGQR